MNMERQDKIPSGESFDPGSTDALHATMPENNVGEHELGLSSAAEGETTKSFSWSLRKVVILASLCRVIALSFGTLSLIAPFYPQEVSLVTDVTGKQCSA